MIDRHATTHIHTKVHPRDVSAAEQAWLVSRLTYDYVAPRSFRSDLGSEVEWAVMVLGLGQAYRPGWRREGRPLAETLKAGPTVVLPELLWGELRPLESIRGPEI